MKIEEKALQDQEDDGGQEILPFLDDDKQTHSTQQTSFLLIFRHNARNHMHSRYP